MVVASYLPYAMDRARFWWHKYPHLREDIEATAMLATVEGINASGCPSADAAIKRFLWSCINNAIKDLLEKNYIIRIPQEEIVRRRKAGLSLNDLPRAMLMDHEDLWEMRRSREAPTWVYLHVADVRELLNLSERETIIVDLRIQGYTLEEIGDRLGCTKVAVHLVLKKLQGRYLTLIRSHPSVLHYE